MKLKPHLCGDCGRRFVYGDSKERHRAVCAVRLRSIIRRARSALGTCLSPLVEWEGADEFPEVIQARASMDEMNQVLGEAGRER